MEFSVGNIVSAGLRIYRDRFKTYYGLAFKAYWWILVPIYGWAKFAAISGQISRLAFNEVREQPEAVKDAERHVMRRMWDFFFAGISIGLIIFGILFISFFILGIIFSIVVTAVVGVGANQQPNIGIIIFVGLGGFVIFSLFLLGYIWLYSRFAIVELLIAVEENIDATNAISRSWNLTQGFVWRLVGVFTVAFLITLPISIIIQIVSRILQLAFTLLLNPDAPNPGLFLLLYYSILLPISFASGALLVPFWQTVKAVIYYDLLTRKEGLGLEMRDPGL
ncbi:MAG: DUF975 domain-containing protein [Oscillatoria sp. PMC 1051.18]|nr:DUF975 domain-containing protein [Oscillatoria sp. PMC 1050.18]MEC5028552.1 DUF975 domain-containing protein [Oscillatoria sp. PMC 1051.18]